MFLARHFGRVLCLLMLGLYTAACMPCTTQDHAIPGLPRAIRHNKFQSLIPRSFHYYQAKIYEFLEYLYGYKVDHIIVQEMSSDDTTFTTRYPAYAKNKFIRLNMEVLQHYSEADNLFICAHEAAHQYCGHTLPSKKHYDTQRIEREADETAAHMLCTYGYRWVVEEYTQQLKTDILKGYGDISDGIHPSSAEKVSYLKPILEKNNAMIITQMQETPLQSSVNNTHTLQSLIGYAMGAFQSVTG